MNNNKIIILWWIGWWIILWFILYLFQVLWMWSFSAPIDFIKDKWYFLLPLIIWFWIQIGLYKAIKLRHQNISKWVIVGNWTISSGSMLACCMHNFIFLFPLIWLSWLATTLAIYQDWILWFSVLFMIIWLLYMIKKYNEITCCSKK